MGFFDRYKNDDETINKIQVVKDAAIPAVTLFVTDVAIQTVKESRQAGIDRNESAKTFGFSFRKK